MTNPQVKIKNNSHRKNTIYNQPNVSLKKKLKIN